MSASGNILAFLFLASRSALVSRLRLGFFAWVLALVLADVGVARVVVVFFVVVVAADVGVVLGEGGIDRFLFDTGVFKRGFSCCLSRAAALGGLFGSSILVGLFLL